METDALLRTILYQAMIADDLDDVISAISVMCSKDLVAAVKEEAEKHNSAKKSK
jgi:hypothetical protein